MRLSFLLFCALAACGGGIGNDPKLPGRDSADQGGEAELAFSPTVVAFGDVAYGVLYEEAIQVSNLGGTDLTMTITTTDPFTVSPSTLALASGRTSTVIVRLQPTTYEDFSTSVTFTTDSEEIGTVEVPLSAVTITDADGDSYDLAAAGGDDCDDEDPDVNPAATEIWYDDVDQNCDGLNDYDQDGDGYEAETDDHEPSEPDCIDTNPDVNPGAEDVPYDGVDADCSGQSDWDQDGDGSGSAAQAHGSDCDDSDPDINTSAEEAFNGVDDDCDGESDNSASADASPYIYDADGSTDRAGFSVAVGDLDGDELADVVVGAPYSTKSGQQRGGVAVFTGGDLMSTGTTIDDADNWFNHDSQSAQLGAYVTVMGDMNGNGFNDLAVSAPGLSSNAGAVYVIDGDDASNRDLDYALTTITGNTSSQLGRGLGTDIDLNSDGMAELVMAYTNGSSNYVAVQYGASSLSNDALDYVDARFNTDGSEVAFYRNAPVGGDFDGDGYDDLVLSDGKADYGSYSDSGAVWILWGQASTWTTPTTVDIESQATTVNYGTSNSSYNGWATQLGEDWDGDGDDELWLYDAADSAMYVIEGGTTGRSSFTASTAASVTYLWGSSTPDAEMIRRAGDFTGDGVDDMLVFIEDESGSTGLSELFSSEVQSGSHNETSDNIGDLGGSSDWGNGNVGFGMAPLGADIDGDGDDDLAVGDPEFNSNAGQVYVILNKLVND